MLEILGVPHCWGTTSVSKGSALWYIFLMIPVNKITMETNSFFPVNLPLSGWGSNKLEERSMASHATWEDQL